MVENWMRRHAIQIAAQLPEDPEHALAVLDLAKQIVQDFLLSAQPALPALPLERPAAVIVFPASSSSR